MYLPLYVLPLFSTPSNIYPHHFLPIEGLGTWLLIRLFKVCEHARSKIATEVVTRLLLSSTASTGGQAEKGGFGGLPSGAPGQALATANTCVAMLAQLMTGR